METLIILIFDIILISIVIVMSIIISMIIQGFFYRIFKINIYKKIKNKLFENYR